MQVQTCFFAQQTYFCFDVLVAVAVVVAKIPIIIQSFNVSKMF